VVGDQGGESAGIALADGADFPTALAAVDFGRDDDGFGGQAVDSVLVQQVPGGVADAGDRRADCPKVVFGLSRVITARTLAMSAGTAARVTARLAG